MWQNKSFLQKIIKFVLDAERQIVAHIFYFAVDEA